MNYSLTIKSMSVFLKFKNTNKYYILSNIKNKYMLMNIIKYSHFILNAYYLHKSRSFHLTRTSINLILFFEHQIHLNYSNYHIKDQLILSSHFIIIIYTQLTLTLCSLHHEQIKVFDEPSYKVLI